MRALRYICFTDNVLISTIGCIVLAVFSTTVMIGIRFLLNIHGIACIHRFFVHIERMMWRTIFRVRTLHRLYLYAIKPALSRSVLLYSLFWVTSVESIMVRMIVVRIVLRVGGFILMSSAMELIVIV